METEKYKEKSCRVLLRDNDDDEYGKGKRGRRRYQK